MQYRIAFFLKILFVYYTYLLPGNESQFYSRQSLQSLIFPILYCTLTAQRTDLFNYNTLNNCHTLCMISGGQHGAVTQMSAVRNSAVNPRQNEVFTRTTGYRPKWRRKLKIVYGLQLFLKIATLCYWSNIRRIRAMHVDIQPLRMQFIPFWRETEPSWLQAFDDCKVSDAVRCLCSGQKNVSTRFDGC